MHQHADRPYLPAMGHDRLLPLYDTFTRLVGVPRAHRILLDAAAIGPGQHVLELGCGTGNLTVAAKRRHPDATVSGIDPDPSALAAARRKVARRGLAVTLERGFAGSLTAPDASLDRVLSSLMYHHLDTAEKDRMLAEVRRVLRPGGQLLLLDFGGSAGAPRGGRFAEHAGDRIPARLRAAGFAEAAEVRRLRLLLPGGRCAVFRAVR